MFDLLSLLLHFINSIFSGLYTSWFLKSKQNKKMTITLWSFIYFVVQVVVFDMVHSWYPFNNKGSDLKSVTDSFTKEMSMLNSTTYFTTGFDMKA